MTDRLFQEVNHANLYARYRPTYPKQLIERMITFMKDKCKLSGNFDAAVDVGCGTGQLTRELASNFKTVTGVDVSEAQLQCARNSTSSTNITYRFGTGENIPIESSSVELLTCAQAVHWFDFSKFCKEADRILKPGGCLAIIGYSSPAVLHYQGSPHKELDRIFKEFLDGPMESYRAKENDLLDNKYIDLKLPYNINDRDDSFLLKREMTLTQFVNYVQSWAYYQLYKKDYPEEHDDLEEFRLKIIAEFSKQSSDDIELTLMNPMFLLLASKPNDD